MTQGSVPDGVLHLDELQMLVVVDNETDTLSSVDEGLPQIPEVAHLAARTAPSGQHDGHDCKVVLDQLCCACHGLSVLVTGRRGDAKRSMLFDVGPYPDLWLDNARRLGIDLSTIEHVFLSHWHFDHSGGFPKVVAAVSALSGTAGVAVVSVAARSAVANVVREASGADRRALAAAVRRSVAAVGSTRMLYRESAGRRPA